VLKLEAKSGEKKLRVVAAALVTAEETSPVTNARADRFSVRFMLLASSFPFVLLFLPTLIVLEPRADFFTAHAHQCQHLKLTLVSPLRLI
jgi:hypothetical protein